MSRRLVYSEDNPNPSCQTPTWYCQTRIRWISISDHCLRSRAHKRNLAKVDAGRARESILSNDISAGSSCCQIVQETYAGVLGQTSPRGYGYGYHPHHRQIEDGSSNTTIFYDPCCTRFLGLSKCSCTCVWSLTTGIGRSSSGVAGFNVIFGGCVI